MSQQFISKKICMAVSPWTGEKCKAKAVNSNTVKKGTKEFLDDRFCQMHQPGVESKKKCVCVHCNYHRTRDKSFIEINPDTKKVVIKQLKLESESSFGKKKKK